MAEQLELEMPVSYQVGESVWWTHGLTYLCATYKKGGKIRPESGELVRIESLALKEQTSYGMTSRTARVYSFEDKRDYHVHPRWLSASESQPCEAVFEAYGKWGN